MAIQSLTDLQKMKLFKEAQALIKNLSLDQIDQALASDQFANDEFIFSLIQQARQERDSLLGKIKRWYRKHEEEIKYTAKLNGIIYGIIVGLSIIGYGILFAIGTVFVISPLSPLGIAIILGFPLIGMVVNQVIQKSFTWALTKIIHFFRKKTPEEIQTEEKAETLKQQLKETHTPSFEEQLQPKNADMARIGLLAFKIAAKKVNSFRYHPACPALLDAMKDRNVTSYSFERSYYNKLDRTDVKALCDILPFTKISTLKFSEDPLNQTDLLTLAKQKQIKEITIESTPFNNLTLDDAGLQEIAKQPHLKSFSYQHLNPVKETYKAFLLTNTTLNELSFNLPAPQNNRDVNVEDIISYLKQNKNLTTIQMRIPPQLGIFQLTGMIVDLFKSNFQLQKVSLSAPWGAELSINLFVPFVKRNKQLAEVREQAQTLLTDLKLNRTLLNSEQMSRVVNAVADNLIQTTYELLQDVISNESEKYKSEIEELANELHAVTAEWIEKDTDRKIRDKNVDESRPFNMEYACRHFFAITSNNQGFSSARLRAFDLAYAGYFNAQLPNPLEALNEAFAVSCLDQVGHLISFNEAEQRVIDKKLAEIITEQKSTEASTVLQDDKRLAFLQYGLMKHAYQVLFENKLELSPIMQVKRDGFKDRFAKMNIDFNDESFTGIKKLWGYFLEAQGAIQDQNMKLLLDAICGYGEKIARASVSLRA